MKNRNLKKKNQNRPDLDFGFPTSGKASDIRHLASDFRGITLIALIITIIVMLILVAVTISIAVNSGLFGHARNASEGWKEAQEAEQKLGNGEVNFTVGNKTYNSIDEYLAENPSGGNGERGNLPVVHEGVTIPEGFTVSGIPEEKTVDGGLVIYEIPEGTDTSAENFWTETVTIGDQTYPKVQTEYNQFVWVPVETPYVTKGKLKEIITNSEGAITTETQALQSLVNSGTYPMAVKISETDYRGVLYEFSEGTSGVEMTVQEFSSTADYNGRSEVGGYREPAKLIGISDTKEQELELQTEYNNAVKSVVSQKGFWVARYELSYNVTNNKGESKRGKTVASAADTATSSWYGLYEASKTVVNSESTKSTMISGSEWGQIMIWMKEVKNTSDNTKYYVLDSRNMGNYTGSPQVSGYKNEYGVKQVYDLGGNFSDLTSEADGPNGRIFMGANYSGGYPASYRYGIYPAYTEVTDSTRSVLYVML